VAANAVPLPEARPDVKPGRDGRHHRHYRTLLRGR
jgi:hypothetical protein